MQFTLKQARQLAGKTQAQVADYLGIDRGTYVKYEANPEIISVGMAKAIANYLGFSVDAIFF